MQGKHVVITGPTSGIGEVCALQLAKQGAQLSLLCRSVDKGQALAQRITDAGGAATTVVELQMASLDSVRAAATRLLELGNPIDILLNNAGVVNTQRQETVDGYEETFAVNHLAPFLLTGMLLPLLEAAAPARIVNVASDAHHFVRGMDFDDLQSEHGYKTFTVYGRSKLANILFNRRLAQLLDPNVITVNALHPGAVATGIGKQNGGWMASVIPALLRPFFRSPERGASTSLYLCESEGLNGLTGGYYVMSKLTDPKPWACDDEAASRLWTCSEALVDFVYPQSAHPTP